MKRRKYVPFEERRSQMCTRTQGHTKTVRASSLGFLKALEFIFYLLCALGLLWIIVSWGEIAFFRDYPLIRTTPTCNVHTWWNFWDLIMKYWYHPAA